MRRESYVLPLLIERLDDGRYLGRSSYLPGLNVRADSIEEVVRLAPKVAKALIAAMKSKRVSLPPRLIRHRSQVRLDVLVSA